MSKKAVVGLMVGLMASTSWGAGIAFSEHAASATAVGGAVVSTVDDASAIYYNPGAVARLKGTQFYMGATVVMPSLSYTQNYYGESVTTDSNELVAPVPSAFATYQIDDELVAGLGFYLPWGLSSSWPDGPQADQLREQAFRTPTIAPVIAMDLGDWKEGLSVGAGVDVTFVGFRTERDVFLGDEIGQIFGSATGIGVTGRFGIHMESPYVDNTKFGLMFRTPMNIELEGDFDFQAPEEFREIFPADQGATGAYTMPWNVALGMSSTWLEDESLTTSIDIQYWNWSSSDEIVFNFDDGSSTVLPRDWNDSLTVRFGLEYNLDPVYLRAGYTWDQTPVPTSTLTSSLPDVNRNFFNGGIGAKLGDFVVDVAVSYLHADDRTALQNDPYGVPKPFTPEDKATYSVDYIGAAMHIGYTFGGGEEEAAAEE